MLIIVTHLSPQNVIWESRTEYYYAGEDYLLKHSGRLDLPDDIMEYIRNKCVVGGAVHGK